MALPRLNTLWQVPSELGNLTSLKYLTLAGNNQIRKNIPSEWGRMTSLMHLDLSYTGFGGSIPSELANLRELTFLRCVFHSVLALATFVPNPGYSARSLQPLGILIYNGLSVYACPAASMGAIASLPT
jgi:hypothetical protein